jgi:hypothetical protein
MRTCTFAPIENEVDLAGHAKGREPPIDLCIRQPTPNDPAAETVFRRPLDLRASTFGPGEMKVIDAILGGDTPIEIDPTVGNGQRSIFARIGGELVQHGAKRNHLRRFERDFRAFDLEPFAGVGPEGCNLTAHRIRQVGACPILREQQAVRVRQSL